MLILMMFDMPTKKNEKARQNFIQILQPLKMMDFH
jgi:CRISPR/Cas system-associated protein endoribonuclease Cas2